MSAIKIQEVVITEKSAVEYTDLMSAVVLVNLKNAVSIPYVKIITKNAT